VITTNCRLHGAGAYLARNSQCFCWDQQAAASTAAQFQEVMASGTVKFFNTEKGFGFITPDEGGKDVFVHKTGTRVALYEGDKVTYEVEQSPKGLNAVNVEKA
jgi:cold shock protein